ncbi:glycosyltransferase family protein [Paenibacillus sp. N1-5-1-14]|uniref:glycosyltransferase family protein n=1 Tax=Paenibacillus radicibacter TaxID=2972488 RepID=UPI0021599BDD|nr:glycosyltransferase family protein [Paenibacillus radicibacter]MCR8642779.1 glycosyltransferase family protein [Paenibacillus radicibacter]
MNPYKIAFIACVNDDKMFEKCRLYLNRLYVPPGYSIEIIPIYGAGSMTSGYNRGMRASDAKYKFYIHQDSFIQYIHTITECLSLFINNPQIGLIGVIGTTKLAQTGSWWEAGVHYGTVDAFFQSETTLCIGKVYQPYIGLESIDGVFMATQVDIDWDENVTGFHFYDASQCIRFRQRYYEIAVPRQDTSWVYHYCLDDVDYDEYYRLRTHFIPLYAPYLFGK